MPIVAKRRTETRVLPYRDKRYDGIWIPKGHFAERNANRRAREALAQQLEQDFVETFNVFRRNIDTSGLTTAIETGNAVGVEQAVGLFRVEGRLTAQIIDSLNDAVSAGGQLGLRFAPTELAGVDPALVTEFAASFIESQGGALIPGVLERTRAGVQRALLDQLTGQVSPTQAAARIGDLVGLSPRQVQAVNRFRTSIESQLIPVAEAETELVRAVIERRVQAEARRQLRARGRLIADTEIQTAIQHGERSFWQIAGDQGAVDLAMVKKTWQTVNDGRVCPICMPMHGQEVFEQDSFSSPTGWVGLNPPAHPRCRCYIIWQIAEELAAA